MPGETDPEAKGKTGAGDGGDPADKTKTGAGEPDKGDTDTDWEAEARKWKSLARKHEDQAKANAAAAQKLAAAEDAEKSEIDKAKERAAAAEKKAADAELRAARLEVAAAKGLSPAMAKRLVGSTVEELEADAAELLKEFKPAGGEGDKGGGTPSGRPREALKAGATPGGSQPEETDPKKLAEKIPRMYD